MWHAKKITTNELKAIRKWRQKGGDILIMILSDSNDIALKLKAFEYGADDYVARSCHIKEIIIRIWVLARRNYLIPAKKITAGNLELDLSSNALIINEEKIRLTSFEFEILKMLINNPGKAISKRKIIRHLYQDWIDKETNSVEVLISRLRKKLAPYNSGQIITQREEGYYYDQNGPSDKR